MSIGVLTAKPILEDCFGQKRRSDTVLNAEKILNLRKKLTDILGEICRGGAQLLLYRNVKGHYS